MKKITALIISFVLFFSLTACSTHFQQAGNTSSSGTVSEAESSEGNSGLKIDESQLKNLGKPRYEFDITTDELMKVIDKSLKGKKYPILSDQMPRAREDRDDDMGVTNESQYSLGNGIILSLYADKENKKITKIEFFISTSITTTESVKYYACCADAIIRYLDAENANKIEKKLNLSNIETNQRNYADTEKYSFSYNVTDGTDVLMIKPQK